MTLEFHGSFVISVDPTHVTGEKLQAFFDDMNALTEKHSEANATHLEFTLDMENVEVPDYAELPEAVQAVIDAGLTCVVSEIDAVDFVDEIREIATILVPMGQAIFTALVSEYGVDNDSALVYAKNYIDRVSFRKILPDGHSYTKKAALFDCAVDFLTSDDVVITYSNDGTSPEVEEELYDMECIGYFALVIGNEAVVVCVDDV